MLKVISKVQSDTTYDHNGKAVTIKGHSLGAVNVVTPEDYTHLQENPIFNLHKTNGFITVEEIVPEEEGEEMLLGSDTQPSTFELEDGSTLQLGDVVRQAFIDSRLSVKDWNKMKADKREKAIAKAVAALPLKQA